MRYVVTGGRNNRNLAAVRKTISALPGDATVVNGGASGIDTLCADFARSIGLNVETINAEWAKYGKAAGHIRNAKMLETADYLIAFNGGRGTADCVRQARAKGIPVIEAEERVVLQMDDKKNLRLIKEAEKAYENGEIVEAGEMLKEVVKSIDAFDIAMELSEGE